MRRQPRRPSACPNHDAGARRPPRAADVAFALAGRRAAGVDAAAVAAPSLARTRPRRATFGRRAWPSPGESAVHYLKWNRTPTTIGNVRRALSLLIVASPVPTS